MSRDEADFVVEQPRDRLDVFLANSLNDESRTALQGMIRNGQVTVNGEVITKAAFEVRLGDSVRLARGVPEPAAADPIPLEVVFESEELLVINKAPGIVVHSSPGHAGGTLSQAVAAYAPELGGLGEPGREGLVHRLDKDTSGLIVFAKTRETLETLQHQFKAREVSKTYLALVDGAPPSAKGRVEASIARDPRNRQRFSVQEGGREAITEFSVRTPFGKHSLVEAFPITGRTHQIRIHMNFLGCPVVGDRVYGRKVPSLDVDRQQLHAWKLKLPAEAQEFVALIPEDMEEAIRLAKDSAP